jgi:hypothetical protein
VRKPVPNCRNSIDAARSTMSATSAPAMAATVAVTAASRNDGKGWTSRTRPLRRALGVAG